MRQTVCDCVCALCSWRCEAGGTAPFSPRILLPLALHSFCRARRLQQWVTQTLAPGWSEVLVTMIFPGCGSSPLAYLFTKCGQLVPKVSPAEDLALDTSFFALVLRVPWTLVTFRIEIYFSGKLASPSAESHLPEFPRWSVTSRIASHLVFSLGSQAHFCPFWGLSTKTEAWSKS